MTRAEHAGSVLTDEAPPIAADQARDILRSRYGLDGAIDALPSERDHNFRVRTADRGEYVLKVTHPGEPRMVTNFQTAALRHIASNDPDLSVPAVLPTIDGHFEPEFAGDGPPRVVRLLTYLPGQLLIQAPRSAAQDRALGAFLARLGRALQGFSHPAAGATDILWDLRQVPRVKRLVPEIADGRRRALAARALDDAETHALPILPTLRAQVVHNDLNPSNAVVAHGDPARVTGVLDFGDMLHGPLICDVAVAASYRWSPGEPPLAGAARFVAGYHGVTALEAAEFEILFDLVRARLALTVAIVNWQVSRFPEKRDYLLRMNGELWAFLEALSGLSRDAGRAALRSEAGGGRR